MVYSTVHTSCVISVLAGRSYAVDAKMMLNHRKMICIMQGVFFAHGKHGLLYITEQTPNSSLSFAERPRHGARISVKCVCNLGASVMCINSAYVVETLA